MISKTFETRGFKTHDGAAKVEKIKELASELEKAIDNVLVDSEFGTPTESREAGRLVAVAKTNLEQSVMWAVKAVSRL